MQKDNPPSDTTAEWIEQQPLWAPGADMRDALADLICSAEQVASDNGEDDLIEATPEYNKARAAVEAWDAALEKLEAAENA